MRIIGGQFRKKNLFSVKGLKTRPITDRLREALFNIISTKILDAVVLDLYAGTGALGIESLSRGAFFAAFIDNDKEALSVIKKNITSCKLSDRSRIINCDVLRGLNCLNSLKKKFNFVFMDPPYNKGTISKTLNILHKSRSIEENANIIIEHSDMESVPTDIKEYVVYDQRKYGKTLITFIKYIL